MIMIMITINDDTGIWVCPATRENLEKTIDRPHLGEHSWALNGTVVGRAKFDRMRIGDVCLFGNMKDGFWHVGVVSADCWPVPSPSGTPWKHVFVLGRVYACDIPGETARRLRGWTSRRQGWQTQTLLRHDT